MHIKSLSIKGFGSLSGDFEFLPGLNIIVGDNEAGKSTLSAAILALLYGTRQVRGQKRVVADEHKRFTPFSNSEFAVSGIVELKNKQRLNIWRDLHNDVYRVIDVAGGKDISADFARSPNGDIIGKKLLGLSRAQFEKLAFLKQEDLTRSWDFSEFSDSLSALFSSEDGQGQTIEQALSSLDTALVKYPGVTGSSRIKIETEIKRIEKRLAEIDESLRDMESECARAEQAFAEVARKAEQNEALEREIASYEFLAAQARQIEISENIARRHAARDKVAQINETIAQYSELEGCDFSKGARLSELAALRDDRKKSIAETVQKLQTVQARVDFINSRAEEFAAYGAVTEEQLRKVEFGLQRLAESQRRLSSAKIDAHSSHAALKADGFDPTGLEKFFSWYAQLSEQEQEFCATYSSQQSEFELELSKLKNSRDNIEHSRVELEYDRKDAYKVARMHVILSGVLLLVSCGAFFVLGMLWFMAVPPVLCLGWGVFGISRMLGASSLGGDESSKINHDLQILQLAEDELDRKRKECAEEFDQLSEAYDNSEGGLLEALPLVEKNHPSVNSWRQTHQRVAELEAICEETGSELREVISTFASDTTGHNLTVSEIEKCLRDMKEAVSIFRHKEEAGRELEQLSAKLVELQNELEQVGQQLAQIISLSGMEWESADEKFIQEYNANQQKLNTLAQLREKELPEALEACGAQSVLDSLQAESHSLQKRIDKALELYPDFARLEVEKSVAEYEAMCAQSRRQISEDSDALNQFERSMTVEFGRYRDALPRLSDEREQLQLALQKANSFSQAVSCATEKLEVIAAELHSRWSPVLANELNSLVSIFSDRWKFELSRELRLTVRAVESGTILDEAGLATHLSSGMREQVYLCLRSVLARRLGTAQPLPLILDDPYVNADDTRFLSGMDYLYDLAEGNQVFVFSCHRSRHSDLLESDAKFTDSVLSFF